MIQSDIMLSAIMTVLPNGLPSEEDVARMTQSEKEQLYMDQKLIIQIFRERSQAVISSLQERLASRTSSDSSNLGKTRSEVRFSVPLEKPLVVSQPRQREIRRTRPRVMTSSERILDTRPMSLRRLDAPKKCPSVDQFALEPEPKEVKRQRYANLQDRPRFKL